MPLYGHSFNAVVYIHLCIDLIAYVYKSHKVYALPANSPDYREWVRVCVSKQKTFTRIFGYVYRLALHGSEERWKMKYRPRSKRIITFYLPVRWMWGIKGRKGDIQKEPQPTGRQTKICIWHFFVCIRVAHTAHDQFTLLDRTVCAFCLRATQLGARCARRSIRFVHTFAYFHCVLRISNFIWVEVVVSDQI